ncbi:hypothetical protein HMI56_000503 [Coelomomyces lativittatus]|nr:hypothetical protein HMI56_000503 [Coelomomyces lativittatus]
MSSSTRPPRAAKLPNSTTLTNPHTHSASTLASSSTTSSFQPTLPPPPSTSSTPLSSHPTFSSTTTRAAAAAAAAAAASVVPSTSTNAATTATATTTPTTTSKRLTKTKQLLDEHGPMKKPVSIIHKSHPVVTKPMSHMSIASIPSVQEQNEKADWLPVCVSFV